MQSIAPHSRATLLHALSTAEGEAADFFASLAPEELALRIDSAWTPVEHLEHLCIAVSAVARGFSAPRWLLRIRFGRARRASRGYDQLCDDYRARLAAGGRATGQFVPVREALTDEQGALRRTELLARWGRVNTRLRAGVEAWTERDLDRIHLPHPLLGKITAREMLFFSIYHVGHHMEAAKKRLPRFTRA